MEVAHSSKRQNKILPLPHSLPNPAHTTMSGHEEKEQKRVEKLDVESDQDRQDRLGKLRGRGVELTTGSLFASMTRPEEGNEGLQMPTERTRPFAMPQSDGTFSPSLLLSPLPSLPLVQSPLSSVRSTAFRCPVPSPDHYARQPSLPSGGSWSIAP